jgi:hypothetical protein
LQKQLSGAGNRRTFALASRWLSSDYNAGPWLVAVATAMGRLWGHLWLGNLEIVEKFKKTIERSHGFARGSSSVKGLVNGTMVEPQIH